MKEKEKFDFIFQDRRVMERNLRRHLMTRQDYNKYLKSLEDNKDWGEESILFKEGNLEEVS